MEKVTPQPMCAAEALDLLNCVCGPDFNRDNCLRFVDALRQCVVEKKVKNFSLIEQRGQESQASKEKK